MVKPPDHLLLSYLASYDPHVSRLALAVREVVLEEAPDAIDSISKGYAVAIGFSFTGKPLKDGFCHVVTYSSYVNLGFNRGALLPDPNRVLAGSGKLIRHITIRDERDLDRPHLRRYIQAAIEQLTQPASSARLCVVRGLDSQLAVYETAARSLTGKVDETGRLTVDNPVQQESVRWLRTLVEARLAASDELVAARTLQGRTATENLLLGNCGKERHLAAITKQGVDRMPSRPGFSQPNARCCGNVTPRAPTQSERKVTVTSGK